MISDQLGSGIIILLLGIACLVLGLIYLKKDKFLNTNEWAGFKNTLFLPPIVNFWLLKIFLVVGGSAFVLLGIYLILYHFL